MVHLPPRISVRLAGILMSCGCIALATSVRADDDSGNVTVVSAKVSTDYVRTRLPDGTYQAESYAFGDGGHWTGTVVDGSLDKLKFIDVARAIAYPLAKQSFLPTDNPRTTKQLIMVYWGRTLTPERFQSSVASDILQRASANQAAHKSANEQFSTFGGETVVPPAVAMPCGKFDPATTVDQVTGQIDADNAMTSAMSLVSAENHSRDLMDAKNASLLGYDTWWDSTASFKGTPLEHRRQDMLDELEHDRYFVILMAYDFQGIWKQKKHKLLWETRFSVRQRGVDFDKALPLMVKNAAKYFGQDSHGLLHEELPTGRVDVGKIETLGTVAATK
jgi:hypothetical protein